MSYYSSFESVFQLDSIYLFHLFHNMCKEMKITLPGMESSEDRINKLMNEKIKEKEQLRKNQVVNKLNNETKNNSTSQQQNKISQHNKNQKPPKVSPINNGGGTGGGRC